jgi:hypothetical protein
MLNIIIKFLKGDEDAERNSKLQMFDFLILQYYRILEVLISTDLVYKSVVWRIALIF